MTGETLFNKVCNTYRYHGIPMSSKPALPTYEEFDFRFSFMLEEIGEMQDAFHVNDLVGMADALGDLAIVINGLAASMGIPFDAITDAINTANYNGKRIVTSYDEGKRGYAYDLIKTANFEEPKNIIRVLIEREKNNECQNNR
jgi:predicted HAD superfamily Cof-like phosphohydrolase